MRKAARQLEEGVERERRLGLARPVRISCTSTIHFLRKINKPISSSSRRKYAPFTFPEKISVDVLWPRRLEATEAARRLEEARGATRRAEDEARAAARGAELDAARAAEGLEGERQVSHATSLTRH